MDLNAPLQSYTTNDRVTLKYYDSGAEDTENRGKPWLIFIHGWTASHKVWQRNIPAFTPHYRVIAPDLRGHGDSDKPKHGFQVSRLAMDLSELVVMLQSREEGEKRRWRAVGGSLGCAILWAYASLFTTSPFSYTIFVDQSPLQNTLPDWSSLYCNRGMNSASSIALLQSTLATSPSTAHLGTIAACLGYRYSPHPSDPAVRDPNIAKADEDFFLREALKGEAVWLGKLMADHTALDWRASIAATFGPASGSETKVLVVASERSGCFPAAGPLCVVGLVGERARGVSVGWGGHWCFWEDPAKFNKLCLEFLADAEAQDEEQEEELGPGWQL